MIFWCSKVRFCRAIVVATGLLLLYDAWAISKPVPAIRADVTQFEPLWLDLEKGDAEASRALLKMSSRPKEAVDFLAKKLRPLKIEPEQVNALLGQLASNDEAIWKKAFVELEYFDPRLAIDLETLMKTVTEAPARQRMVEILSGRAAESLAGQDVNLRAIGQGEGYNFFAKGSWWAEHKVERINSNGWGNTRTKWTQCVRALILLEHIGTPDAIAVLETMSRGHPDAQPTKVANEALKRIGASNR
jgi:hypothetical protein